MANNGSGWRQVPHRAASISLAGVALALTAGCGTTEPTTAPSAGPSTAASAKQLAQAIQPQVAAGTGVEQTQESSDEGTIRVVSARFDLTGQEELLWAADEGRPAGDARCTQTFKFPNNPVPRERPAMLMCWRTSAQRSVIVVTVAEEGRPSKKFNLAALGKKWKKLN